MVVPSLLILTFFLMLNLIYFATKCLLYVEF